MQLRELKTGESNLGGMYGEPHRVYGGIIMDITTLPNKTYFHVENGGWWGYIDSDSDGNRIMYTGVNMQAEDPTLDKQYVHRFVLKEGESYDIAIGELKVQGYVEEVRKVRKAFRFRPETDSLEDLQQAFENIKNGGNQMNMLKNDILSVIENSEEDGKIDVETLKKDIMDIYNDIIGGKRYE